MGRAVGQITQQPVGDNGFGFDPVMFIPELNQTYAQMDPEEKNRRSHRGQSAREMVRLLRNTWLAPDAA